MKMCIEHTAGHHALALVHASRISRLAFAMQYIERIAWTVLVLSLSLSHRIVIYSGVCSTFGT